MYVPKWHIKQLQEKYGRKYNYNIYKDVQKNPLIYNLLSNTNYQEQYKEKMYKLIETVEDNDWLINRIDFYADLISNSIISFICEVLVSI